METDNDGPPTDPTSTATDMDPIQEHYTVAIQNSWGMLVKDKNTTVEVTQPDAPAEEAPIEIQRVRMPPIVINAANIHDFSAFRRRVNQICISEFKISYKEESITVYTFCRDDHINIFNDLKKGRISAYSHKHYKDKKILYVLNDLPRGLRIR